MNKRQEVKAKFKNQLKELANTLGNYTATKDGQWTIKGFIDIFKNIYTISADTKIVSKILEIHLFPRLLEFAEKTGYKIVLPNHQNYYPDISFLSNKDPSIKFALDLKTTYRHDDYPNFCNGFTLGSYGEYFINRTSRKNIQFPYAEYLGHFCLGAIYTRAAPENIATTKIYQLDEIQSFKSVIQNIQFFTCEKWEIASDRRGSGNTANIGSIDYIPDILSGNGMFKKLGEEWFDDYWTNYGKIRVKDGKGKLKPITNLADFLKYKKADQTRINPRKPKTKKA